MAERFLSREEAATYIKVKGLRCAKTTLQKYATTGGGPVYQKFGRAVVYTRDNLDKWIESKLSPIQSNSTY